MGSCWLEARPKHAAESSVGGCGGGESRVYLATWLLLVPAEPVLVAFPAASSKPATSRGSTRRCRATAATGSPPPTVAATSTPGRLGAATLPPPTHLTPHPPPSPMSQSLMPWQLEEAQEQVKKWDWKRKLALKKKKSADRQCELF